MKWKNLTSHDEKCGGSGFRLLGCDYSLLLLTTLCLAVLVFPGLFFYLYSDLLSEVFKSRSLEAWAKFGDFLSGSINPFITVITAMLLAFAIRQNQSLLKNTAGQLKRMEDSNETQLLMYLSERYSDEIERCSKRLEENSIKISENQDKLVHLSARYSLLEAKMRRSHDIYNNAELETIKETIEIVQEIIKTYNSSSKASASNYNDFIERRKETLRLLFERGDKIVKKAG